MATTTAQTVYSHITKDPLVRSGRACIDGTRIRVMDIVCLLREGYTPEQMVDAFSVTLTQAQVYAALAYYHDHKEEIEAAFAEDKELFAEGQRKRAEYLRQHNRS